MFSPSKYFHDTKNINNTILVAGVGRSGTTLLAETINYDNQFRLMFEPFNKYKVFSSDMKGNNFTYQSDRSIAFRSFGFNFQYTFGKLNFKAASKQSNIKNDDVQQESNEEF